MDLKFIFLGVLLFIVLIIVVNIILRKRKGSIDILPEKYNYGFGETINGKVVLKIKKSVSSDKLIVGLRCDKSEINYSRGKRSSENYTLFDFNLPLENKKECVPGEYSYDFSIDIPKDTYTVPRGIAVNMIQSINSLVGKNSSLKWYLHSELKCAGVDLSKRIEINVS